PVFPFVTERLVEGRRLLVKRKRQLKMDRRWVQGTFRKCLLIKGKVDECDWYIRCWRVLQVRTDYIRLYTVHLL
ncbi:hypothetical protein BKA83DRAFT_4052487, partial [Pisolithus microcarpus]